MMEFCIMKAWHSLACLMLFLRPWGARPLVPIVSDGLQPSSTFMFRPKPWNLLVGGSEMMAIPLLDRSRLPAQIVSAVSYTTGWPFCCFPQSSCCGSCLFFLTSLIVWAASTRIAPETSCIRPLQEIATRPTVYPCSLPWGLHISGYSSQLPLHISLPVTRPALSRPTSSTAGTLEKRQFLGWFPRCWGKLDSCLDLL